MTGGVAQDDLDLDNVAIRIGRVSSFNGPWTT